MAAIEHDPDVTDISPLVGPLAGKSRIRLIGQYLIPGVLVKLGRDLVCNFESRYVSEPLLYPIPGAHIGIGFMYRAGNVCAYWNSLASIIVL